MLPIAMHNEWSKMGVVMAQWIWLCLSSCGSWFESWALHLSCAFLKSRRRSNGKQYYYLFINCKFIVCVWKVSTIAKINVKAAGMAQQNMWSSSILNSLGVCEQAPTIISQVSVEADLHDFKLVTHCNVQECKRFISQIPASNTEIEYKKHSSSCFTHSKSIKSIVIF